MKITHKELLFCREYLIDFNESSAYIRAGYSFKNYENLQKQASDLLKKPSVANTIAEMKAKRSRRLGISQERIIEEIAKIAFVNINNFYTDGVLNLNNLDDNDMAAISELEIKQTDNGDVYKVKLHDKSKALNVLLNYLGMLSDFDSSISCLREKYGLSLTRDDNGTWEVIDLSRINQQ